MGERLRVKSLWVKSVWAKSQWVTNLLGKIGVGGMLAFVSLLLRYGFYKQASSCFTTKVVEQKFYIHVYT